MIQIFYGTNSININITQSFINNFMLGNVIKIPQNNNFNDYFGDPVPFQIKKIIIKDSGGEYLINEYDSIDHDIILEIKEKSLKKKIHFITFADQNYQEAANRLCKEAHQFNEFNSITFYKPNMITSSYKEEYGDILNKSRGGGYWIWKWDIIKQKLDEIQENDYIIYLDAGCCFNNNGKGRFNEYLELLNESEYGFISFQMGHQEKKWTIKELFKILDIDINSEYANSGQYGGGVLVIKKNKNAYFIINKCIEILEKNKLLVTDEYNHNQHHFFMENRHDQSILSLTRKKYGSVIVCDDIGCGDMPNYAINPPFIATRKRD